MIFAPSSGWRRITAHSSTVSGPGFARMVAGHADLADVVQGGRDRDVAQLRAGHGQPAGDVRRQADQRLGVVARVLVLRPERGAERGDGRQERLLELGVEARG